MTERTCHDCNKATQPVYELGDGKGRCGFCLAARVSRSDALLDDAAEILDLLRVALPESSPRITHFLDRYRAHKRPNPPTPTGSQERPGSPA